jgi:hypothetical protein
MGVLSKPSRTSAFSQGSGAGRTTPVVQTPVVQTPQHEEEEEEDDYDEEEPETSSTPATPSTQSTRSSQTQPTVTTQPTTETAVPAQSEESTTTPSSWSEKLSGLNWGSFLKKQRIPKGEDPKTYGFFKKDGSFETDPEKIARAITFNPGKEWNPKTERRSGNPLGYYYPTYKHPTSGVATGEDFSNDFSDSPAWKDRNGKDSKRVSVWIKGLQDRGSGAVDDDHYYKTTMSSPQFDTWDQATPEFMMKHVVMPMAIAIVKRHEVLNDRANKGNKAPIAVSDATPSGDFTCKFCGQHETKTNRENTPGFENFKSAHKIMSNGWCATALKAHNLLNPIKGSVEEV